MATPLPRRVQVGPINYRVVTGRAAAQIMHRDGRNLLGMSNHMGQEIVLSPEQRGEDETTETLMHEVLHCIWDQTPLRNSSNLTDHEESIVVAFSAPLVDTLRRNPRLADRLLAR